MESASNLRHDWQEQLMRQLAELVKAQQSTAVTLERINGRLDNLDQRLKIQESSPQDWRAALTGYGGCLGQIVFAGLSMLGLTLSVISLVLVFVRR